MCQPLSPEQETVFGQTVDEFVQEGRAFTGYDLTIATRNREGMKIRHKDVREGIHEMAKLRDLVDFDDWNVSLENIGQNDGQTIQARIYYPDGYDLSQYEPIGLNPPTSQSVSPAAPQVATQPATPTLGTPLGSDDDEDDDDLSAADDVGSQNADGTFGTNFRGGLFIRTQFLRNANLNPHDSCQVIVENASITLSPMTISVSAGADVSQRVIERNGDLRLAKRTLLEANMSGDRFKIENTKEGVLITEA